MMIVHFESIHIDLWDVIENGNYIPYDAKLNKIPKSQWVDEQNYILLLNSKAHNALQLALSEEYTKVHSI